VDEPSQDRLPPIPRLILFGVRLDHERQGRRDPHLSPFISHLGRNHASVPVRKNITRNRRKCCDDPALGLGQICQLDAFVINRAAIAIVKIKEESGHILSRFDYK
jgi:hypothetical protein